jgi:paraquat-inducible protein A
MAQSLGQRYPKYPQIPYIIALSAALLTAGLLMPLMNIEKLIFWKNDYSVMTGITGLFHDGQYFLGAILFFFCLVFPIVKLVMLWFLWQFPVEKSKRDKILIWLGLLGKWSMLDVFVVAILIVAVKLGPLANVTPQAGVYVFTVAIILSITTTMWLEKIIREDER